MHDVIVVGSGAGGAAAAYRLARRPLRLDAGEGMARRATAARSPPGGVQERQGIASLVRQQGQQFILANTAMSAARRRSEAAFLAPPHEFEADADHQCLAWPFGYEELPSITTRPSSSCTQPLPQRRRAAAPGRPYLPPRPELALRGLPLGLPAEILEDEQEAKHFDGYASVAGYMPTPSAT